MNNSLSKSDISNQDVIRLFELLQSQITTAIENSAAARESASAAKESAALAVRKVIDLETTFNDFRNDSLVYREVRAELDRQEALQQIEAAQKKLLVVPGSTQTPSTQERIDKAVTTAISKNKIDWMDIWKNKIVPALAILTATTLWGSLLWAIIVYLVLPALNRIAGN